MKGIRDMKNGLMKLIITDMKNYIKYICLFLVIVGMSLGQKAWATTETMDFSSNCWGMSPNGTYSSGTYSAGGYTLMCENVSYNTYNNSILLNYQNNTREWGAITLPSGLGVVSSIKVYTINASSNKVRYVDLYVNGVNQNQQRSVIPDATHYATPAQWTGLNIAAGSTIMIKNATNNDEFHVGSIEIIHNGSAIGTAIANDGKGTVSGIASPVGAGTISISPTRQDAYGYVTISTSANPGYVFDHWVAYRSIPCSGSESEATDDVLVGEATSSNNEAYMDGVYDAGYGDYAGYNIRLVAVFEEADTYSITYDQSKALCAQNGSGSWPANVTDITPDATYSSLPTDIELNGVDGYTFAGWTTNGSYSSSSTAPSPLYTTSITVDADKTLYPVFSNSGSTGGSVTFNRKQNDAMAAGYYLLAIGQSGDQPCLSPTLNTTTYKLDPISASVTSASASVTDRQAMWQVEASGTYWTIKNVYTGKYLALRISGGDIQNNKIDMLSNVTNDAKWSVIQKGEHYFFQSAANANYYLTYKSSTWYAHDFTGKTDNDINNYSGSIYLYKATTTPGSVTTTYTITPPCTTYTLTYHANGAGSGSVPAAAMEYASGAIVTVLGNSGDLAKTGYDFNGWKADNASSGTAYAAGSSITMNANHTLYAQWAAHTIELDLDANGGVSDGSASVKYDATALESGTVHVTGQTGQTLLGYYAAADGDKKVLNATGTFVTPTVADYISSSKWIMDVTPTTLFAHWRANTYTVVFNKNDGGGGATGTMSDQVFTYGVAQNLTSNAFTWASHNFEGWATTPGGSVTYGNGQEVINLSSTDGATVNLYAVWTDKEYDDYKFSCVNIDLVTEDHPTPVYITSRNGINIMAAKKLLLTVDGTTGTIDLNATDLHFYKKVAGTGDDAGKYKYVELTGANRFTAPITDEDVYVSYSPSSASSEGATSAITSPTITVTCGAHERTYDGKVKVRNLPNDIVIATKAGGNWYALPANMASATNPAGIQIDVNETNWTATAPATTKYKLWPVKTVQSTYDRFGTATSEGYAWQLYGDRLRFAGNSALALHANNSNSDNTLWNATTLDAINVGSTESDPANKAYEWKVTTTESGGTLVYTLSTDQSNTQRNLCLSSSSIWGTYASGTSTLYLLPMTVVEEADITVMEWGTTEMALKCATNTTLTKVIVNDVEVTPKPTLATLSGDIMKLSGLPNMAASEDSPLSMQKIVIVVKENGSSDRQEVLHIPFIVTNSTTTVTLRNLAPGGSQDAKNAVIVRHDVIVRNGGTLTVDAPDGNKTACTFNDLYIYPGGKVHVKDNNINVKNVYLRGGFSWLDASKDYRLPQMLVENGKSIVGIGTSGHGVYYDLYLDNAMYYMTAFPKDVALNSVTNEEGTADWTGWVKGYSGEGRTLNPKQSGWKYAWEISPGTTLYRGRGYEIAIKPRYKGAMNGRTIGILRFPLLQATAWSDEATPSISVTAWGIDDANVTANNKGWNYIGNPFFTAFQNTDANGQFGTNMEIRNLQEHKPDGVHWDGKYEWVTDGTVKYITVPEKMYEDYKDVKAKDYTIEAFFPFFIQASATGTLTFTGSKILKARTLMPMTVPAREVEIDFTLSDTNGKSDNAGLVVGNEYSAEFDMDDKEKTIVNENFLKIYTMVGEYRTAFNSLPEATAALPIPVGYIAPAEGKYTFALDDEDYSEVDHIWLTDYEKNVTVDLLDATDYAYEFETVKGTNNTRLALNIVLKPEEIDPIVTGMESIDGYGDESVKFIHQDKMYILYHGVIYDATGKKVKTINK